jgi:hypothetical protein
MTIVLAPRVGYTLRSGLGLYLLFQRPREHAPKGWKWHHADDGDTWNDVHIICKGTRIKTIVNGVVVADYDGSGRLDDDVHRSHRVGMKGHVGLQIHPGKELVIRFKDVNVRELD